MSSGKSKASGGNLAPDVKEALKSAAGDNKITNLRPISIFADANEIESAGFYKTAAAKGTYEIMAMKNGEAVRGTQKGYIIKNGDRTYGVNIDGNKYRTTDLKTGLLIDGNAESFYRVKDVILLFQDRMAHYNMKQLVQNAEERFNKTKRKYKTLFNCLWYQYT